MAEQIHSQARPWVKQPNGRIRCGRHGIEFGTLESCGECASDPGPRPDEASDIVAPTPVDCLSSLDLERQMVADLADLRNLRKSLKVKHFKAYGAITKLSDVIVKMQRALAERIQRRDDDFIVRERERRLRNRDGAAH